MRLSPTECCAKLWFRFHLEFSFVFQSTYCSTMVQHSQSLNRSVQVVNLDPAAEHFDYPVMAGEPRMFPLVKRRLGPSNDRAQFRREGLPNKVLQRSQMKKLSYLYVYYMWSLHFITTKFIVTTHNLQYKNCNITTFYIYLSERCQNISQTQPGCFCLLRHP